MNVPLSHYTTMHPAVKQRGEQSLAAPVPAEALQLLEAALPQLLPQSQDSLRDTACENREIKLLYSCSVQ